MTPIRRTGVLPAFSQTFIWIGLGMGLVYWFLESWLHFQFFSQGRLIGEILTPDIHEIWKRVLVIGLLVVISGYAQYSINIRRQSRSRPARPRAGTHPHPGEQPRRHHAGGFGVAQDPLGQHQRPENDRFPQTRRRGTGLPQRCVPERARQLPGAEPGPDHRPVRTHAADRRGNDACRS